jgi:hypothetical protein
LNPAAARRALIRSPSCPLKGIDTAERLVAWMRRLNLTPTTAAEHLGHRRATITRYIDGSRPVPEYVARLGAIVEASRSDRPFESRSSKGALHAQ